MKSVQYAPLWVRILSALCLGLGTMVGYRRIVTTLGERLGKQKLVPAQGGSAELAAAAVIGVAGFTGFPVSTTHVVTGGISRTMVGSGAGLQPATAWQIATAWALTPSRPRSCFRAACFISCRKAPPSRRFPRGPCVILDLRPPLPGSSNALQIINHPQRTPFMMNAPITISAAATIAVAFNGCVSMSSHETIRPRIGSRGHRTLRSRMEVNNKVIQADVSIVDGAAI
jgi:hypothetical protein